MRVNPKYNNICFCRNLKCAGCSKETECDIMYDVDTGEWRYLKKKIPKPENAPSKVTFKPVPNGYYDTWMKGIY